VVAPSSKEAKDEKFLNDFEMIGDHKKPKTAHVKTNIWNMGKAGMIVCITIATIIILFIIPANWYLECAQAKQANIENVINGAKVVDPDNVD